MLYSIIKQKKFRGSDVSKYDLEQACEEESER